MADDCSILTLREDLDRDGSVDGARLIAQLGLPPDLRYLVDGLGRTRVCLERFGNEFDACIRGDAPLRAVALIAGIGVILDWAKRQDWPSNDPKLLRMELRPGALRNPIVHHGSSVLVHWANLFYALEPTGDAGSAHAIDRDPFERLMREFSAYILAAQSRIDPERYLMFCKHWLEAGQLPKYDLLPGSPLLSRMQSASHAMRQLSLLEHREIFEDLADDAEGTPFPERVLAGLVVPSSDVEKKLLNSIGLLLEVVQPNWARLGVTRRSHRGHGGRRSGRHSSTRDGYIRIAGEDVVFLDTTQEDGVRARRWQTEPPSIERTARDLLIEWGYLPADDLGSDEPGSTRRGSRIPRAIVRRARAEAEIQNDGTEWIPEGENAGDEDIEAVETGTDIDTGRVGQAGHATSKWQRDHTRRFNFAHAVSKDRLTAGEVKRLLRELWHCAAESDGAEALVALHASLALGRPIEDIRGLAVHIGSESDGFDPERIHYYLGSRTWVVPCPPPAWREKPMMSIERQQCSSLRLPDATAFASLLQRAHLDQGGQPFRKLTAHRERILDRFLMERLPSADASRARCANFLFYRLLACTHGDLGIASFVTGHEHSHSRSVHHYANYPASFVVDAYRRAWILADGGSMDTEEQSGASHVVARGYGARRVPRVDAVEALIRFLAAAMQRGTFAERHNAYTAYTLVGMVLGLGMRPVVEPHINNIGDASGDGDFLSFVDKARSDYDRRVNAIPPTLKRHLGSYTAYRHRLFLREARPTRDANFLYVDPATDAPERFRPSHFVAIVGGVFPLEFYALRRFMRTELAQTDGVHAEDVDAYMGHWPSGVSPHDRRSTYPMRRLADLANKPIEALLQRLGYRALLLA